MRRTGLPSLPRRKGIIKTTTIIHKHRQFRTLSCPWEHLALSQDTFWLLQNDSWERSVLLASSG